MYRPSCTLLLVTLGGSGEASLDLELRGSSVSTVLTECFDREWYQGNDDNESNNELDILPDEREPGPQHVRYRRDAGRPSECTHDIANDERAIVHARNAGNDRCEGTDDRNEA